MRVRAVVVRVMGWCMRVRAVGWYMRVRTVVMRVPMGWCMRVRAVVRWFVESHVRYHRSPSAPHDKPVSQTFHPISPSQQLGGLCKLLIDTTRPERLAQQVLKDVTKLSARHVRGRTGTNSSSAGSRATSSTIFVAIAGGRWRCGRANGGRLGRSKRRYTGYRGRGGRTTDSGTVTNACSLKGLYETIPQVIDFSQDRLEIHGFPCRGIGDSEDIRCW